MNKTYILIYAALIAIVVFSYVTHKDEEPSSLKPPSKSTPSKQNLALWYFLIFLVLVGGSVAYVFDVTHPTDFDTYNGSNDSATIILVATFIVLGILGTGARFSYLKYSRVNQADLIAEAIKSHVQPPNSDSLAAPANPSPQTPPDVEDRLRKLASLLADGLISNDDFEMKKQQILDSL